MARSELVSRTQPHRPPWSHKWSNVCHHHTPSHLAQKYANLICMRMVCEHRRMAQGDLVARYRAFKKAEKRLEEARAALEQELTRAINAKEWQIIDVADLLGVSRETVRAIRDRVNKENAEREAKSSADEP